MASDGDKQTYYERLKTSLFNFRPVAWTVLVAVCLLAVVKYYNELVVAFRKAWPAQGNVVFTTPHSLLRERGTVEIRKNSDSIRVVGFEAPVRLEIGAYSPAAHIDNRALLNQPFMAQSEDTRVYLDATFVVQGIVVNGQGRPVPGVVVKIDDKAMKTKNDGVFVIADLPMQRQYDIEAYFDGRESPFTSSQPWKGTVYNANWDVVVKRNIDIVW